MVEAKNKMKMEQFLKEAMVDPRKIEAKEKKEQFSLGVIVDQRMVGAKKEKKK